MKPFGAARQIKALFDQKSIQDMVTTRVPTTWHFNSPAAPHFGNILEAAFKSAKMYLKPIIGVQVLTYEERLNLVTRIEGILNSCPLTPLSSDPHNLCALTHGHF